MTDEDLKMVTPQVDDQGRINIVLLDRIHPGVVPDYCTHGKVTCYGCDEWCWLGDESYKVVASGDVVGVCLQCANEQIPKDAKAKRIGNIEDHKRKDGPHA